jgi:hypothetical protein
LSIFLKGKKREVDVMCVTMIKRRDRTQTGTATVVRNAYVITGKKMIAS